MKAVLSLSAVFKTPVFLLIAIPCLFFASCASLSPHRRVLQDETYNLLFEAEIDHKVMEEIAEAHYQNTGVNKASIGFMENQLDDAWITVFQPLDKNELNLYAFITGKWHPFWITWALNAGEEWEYQTDSRSLLNLETGDRIFFIGKTQLVYTRTLTPFYKLDTNVNPVPIDVIPSGFETSRIRIYSTVLLQSALNVNNDFPFEYLECQLSLNNQNNLIIDGFFQTKGLAESRACAVALKFFFMALEKNQPGLIEGDIRQVDIETTEFSAEFRGLTLQSMEEVLYFFYSIKREP